MSYDKKDLIILSELLSDSRISFSALAEKVKLTVPAVTKRIEKLKQSRIIESFTIDVNYDLLVEGKPTFFMLKCPQKVVNKIIDILYQHPFVSQIYQVSGSYPIILITHYITDKQKTELVKFIQELEDVSDFDMFFVIDTLPAKKELRIENPRSIKLICDYCKREFTGEVFTKIIGGRKRYFCCNTCLTEFEKRFKKDFG